MGTQTAGGSITNVAGDLIQQLAPSAGLPSLHQLPPPVALVGREADVEGLVASLRSGENNGATIAGAALGRVGLHGMGGVGKTAFAIVVAHRMRVAFPDAQLMFDLHGVDREPTRPAAIMERVIQCFHPTITPPEEPDALAAAYRSVLADAGRVLLLLDNAADAEQVRPLLPPPNCLLLVTSRTQFRMQGLACRALDCLEPDAASQLLIQLAPRLGACAAEAASECGHLPLALEVFASVINEKSLYPVPELIARLRAGIEKLGPVDAAFALSLELLPPPLRMRWAQLAVFAGKFDLVAAAAVWGDVADEGREPDAARDAMQALVRACLVERHENADRFRMHDLARIYAERRLTATEIVGARLRHAAHFTEVGLFADRLYLRGGKETTRGLLLFDQERQQIEAAFDWLAGRDDKRSAMALANLVESVGHVSELRFHPRECIRWYGAQYKAATLLGNRAAQGDALGNLGIAYADLGDARQAGMFYRESLAIAREVGNKRSEGAITGLLGNLHVALSEPRQAIEFYEQELAICREIGDRSGEGGALGSLGNAYSDLGDARRAAQFYEQALLISRETGERRHEGVSLGNLGNAYFDLGETRKSIGLYEQALEVARDIGDRRGEGNALGNLGNAHMILGDMPRAIEFHERQLSIAREVGDRRGEGSALGNQGIAYAALGDMRKSLEMCRRQRDIAREIGDRSSEGNALFNSAIAYASLGERMRAAGLAEEALEIFEAIESPHAQTARERLAGWRGGSE